MSQHSSPLGPPPADRQGFGKQVPVYEPSQWSESRRFTVTNGADRWEARLQSLSTEGVGLVLDQRLEQGTMLGVEMSRTSRFFRCLRTLRVWRVIPRPDGTFLAECQFAFPIAYEQLQTLVS
jgi:hypothetical protein